MSAAMNGLRSPITRHCATTARVSCARGPARGHTERREEADPCHADNGKHDRERPCATDRGRVRERRTVLGAGAGLRDGRDLRLAVSMPFACVNSSGRISNLRIDSARETPSFALLTMRSTSACTIGFLDSSSSESAVAAPWIVDHYRKLIDTVIYVPRKK